MEAQGRYSVKCDECKAEIRRTDSLQESAAGGRCGECKATITAEVQGMVRGELLAKLGTMRKPQAFSVRPMSDGRIHIQSDKSCGAFDFRTGRGTLNTKGTYFVHLYGAGAEQVVYPPAFVQACLDVCHALDSVTSRGRVHLRNTIQVV